MAKIVVTTNMSLDGVVEDPDGKEGSRLGGWFNESGGEDLGAWTELLTQESIEAQALLLGRRSDAWFAERWLEREGVWADRLNGMPKFVVSSTTDEAAWGNATVLDGARLGDEMAKLDDELDGEVLVYASYELVRGLLELDLVDALRLFVFPVVLGEGRRLFGDLGEQRPMSLVGTTQLGEGLVQLSYERAR